jgi:hypothetical protein
MERERGKDREEDLVNRKSKPKEIKIKSRRGWG